MKIHTRVLAGVALLLVLLSATAGAAENHVNLIEINAGINPATADFIREAIDEAHRDGAQALIIQLDTPGGLLDSSKAIVKDLLGAPLPVVVYVAPAGAGAASAGVFVTMAANVAAMAPGTNIGAAHPVGGQGENIDGDMREKVENFTASLSKTIAQERGRNIEWAEKAVRESVSITAEEAARMHVVDFVAKDLDDVVTQADGREVDVSGQTRRLALGERVRGSDGHVRVHTAGMRLAQRVLNVVADPNIAYLLMMAGVLGLYVEFTHPGVVFPGVAGAICLLLALTALHVLPLNTSGLALLVLGVALLVAEAFLPTFGLLGVGGLVAFLIGSLFLFDTAGTGVAVDRSLVFGVGGTVAGIMLVVATLVLRSQRARVTHGTAGMVGERGVAQGRLAPVGTVLVRGEYWTAESADVVNEGDPVEVTGVQGLRLRVRRAGPDAR